MKVKKELYTVVHVTWTVSVDQLTLIQSVSVYANLRGPIPLSPSSLDPGQCFSDTLRCSWFIVLLNVCFFNI